MSSENERLNGQIRGLTSQFERVVRIWDAHARGDAEAVTGMLENEILFIVMNYEIWAEMDLDAPTRQMVPVVLELLLAGFIRHGNVLARIEKGGQEITVDCEARCRELLRRYTSPLGEERSG